MANKVNPKNIDYWEKVLLDLPESYRTWFIEERTFLRDNIKKNSKVLEIGCGEGRSLRELIDITQNLTGIDHDEKTVDDAKKRFTAYPKVKIIVAQAENLPFEDNSFDYVICMTTFANFGNMKYKILEEMKRVLRDKGSIIISVFGENALEERMKLYKRLNIKIKDITKNGKVTFEGWEGDNTSEQFSKNKLLEIFKKVNLKVEQIKKVRIAYICKVRKIL